MICPKLAAWNIRGFSSSNKVSFCKNLVQSLHLDMICILENRILPQSLYDLNFSNCHLLFDIEASCHNFHCASSGRIWIKWSTDRISFNPSFFSSQMIAGMVSFGSSTPFLLSVIYASNSQVERKVLWEDIRAISPAGNVPWILMGDFNTCCFSSEKLGGNPLNQNLLNDINSVIFDTNLKNLGSIGPSYTWFNQRTDSPIHIKLDRMLINDQWVSLYPDSFYSIHSPSGSDHCPIVLNSGTYHTKKHHFLYKNYWGKCEQFWVLLLNIFAIKAVGNPLVDFGNKLKLLKESIKGKRWANANVMYDHIQKLQAKQLDCLNLLSDQINFCDASVELKNVNIQLETASSLWFSWVKQRAKAKWLSQGEDDLKFLYSRIRMRRSYKQTAIALAMSTPDTSVSEAIKGSISYFQSLFNAPHLLDFEIGEFPPGHVIDLDFRETLIAPFSDSEIKKTVFKGSSNSTPGPDGFNFDFYKSSWVLIGQSVCNAIKGFYNNAFIPRSIKATAITLILKSSHAESIADFRPIALCNTSYKIIAKILAERMKPFMAKIIKVNQARFIKNRISMDNVILANEILQFSKKSSKIKLMCIKYDIKKAFDTLCNTSYKIIAKILA
ncbi:uncharacterized protein LOC110111848 [Dendrobium catenatum]|uniref:uncharacterized protein LOC110111848 n=1 Tax=Dendrobium catenatum TaxID=906689 RepID=UPI0009F66013|nr:uncharacterized protein LOC110111848 [Dendrobium catenatum]